MGLNSSRHVYLPLLVLAVLLNDQSGSVISPKYLQLSTLMSTPAESRALPWANATANTDIAEKGQSEDQQAMEVEYKPQLSTGQHIEVKWQLTEESGAAATRWWRATVLHSVAENPSVWCIRYDASEGFDPEDAEVKFLSKSQLQNTSDGEVLQWRLEGAMLSEDEDEEGEQEPLVLLKDLTDEQEALEREMGQSVEEAALQHIQAQMAPDQQQTVLAGFRHFADHFKSKLHELVRTNEDPENYVVTANDIQQIVHGLKR